MRFLGGICGVAVVWSFVECGRVVEAKVIWGCGGREPKHGGRLCVWKVGKEGGGGRVV